MLKYEEVDTVHKRKTKILTITLTTSEALSWGVAFLSTGSSILFFKKNEVKESFVAFIIALMSLGSLYFSNPTFLVKGKISLKDNLSAAGATAAFIKRNDIVAKAIVDEKGYYSAKLASGGYSLKVFKAGYEEIILPDVKVIEETLRPDLQLGVLDRQLVLSLESRAGQKYSNVSFEVSRTDRFGARKTYTTNKMGEFLTDALSRGEYEVTLAQDYRPENLFLWRLGTTKKIGTFTVVANKEKYQVILPEIIQTNSTKTLGGQEFSSPLRVISQKFIITSQKEI